MRKIYFVKGDNRRLIGERDTEEEAWKVIYAFLKDHKYDSPYVRNWEDEEGRWYDVGSWSELFLWEAKDNDSKRSS